MSMIGISPTGRIRLIDGLAARVRMLCEEGDTEETALTKVLAGNPSVTEQTEIVQKEIRQDLITLLHKPRLVVKIRHPRVSQGERIVRANRQLGEARTEERHEAIHPPQQNAS